MNIEEYAKYKQEYTDDIPELLAKYLGRVSWTTYLDLGCGDGSLLNALNKQNYFGNKTVYAVDLSETRMQLVKKINPQFICQVGSADDVKNVADSSIDVVVSTQVIEHVPDDQAMANEIKRILKPGAVAYVSTVFKKWYGWYFYRCNGKWVLDPTHVREYYADHQLIDLFRNSGFEILENKKTLIWRSLVHFFLRKPSEALSIPIPGYYNWEIVVKKK